MRVIGPAKSPTGVFMFYGAATLQLTGENLKIHCPKLTVMRRVVHTVSLYI